MAAVLRRQEKPERSLVVSAEEAARGQGGRGVTRRRVECAGRGRMADGEEETHP